MERIDAMGKPCPQPVTLAKAAIDKGAGEIEIFVDNEISASNVTRFLQSQGFETMRSGGEGRILLFGRKSGLAGVAPAVVCQPDIVGHAAGDAFLLLARTMGDESVELGEALMKAFLGVLAQRSPAPNALALMNGGVFLALPESSACDILKEIASKGTKVLVCGTCAKHFGVTERIAVGSISNMFEITETLLAAGKPVVLG